MSDDNAVTRAEWDRLYHTLEDGFKGVHARLDMLNTRTGATEIELAVLRDRSNRTEEHAAAAHQGMWITRIIGALVAGILGFLEFVRWK